MANIPDVNFNKIPDKGVKFNQTEYYESNFDKINEQIVPKVNELDAQLAEKANKTQEEWITPTLLNGWVNFSGYTPNFLKDQFGFVHFKGSVMGGSTGSIVFILPVGYRPQHSVYFRAYGINADCFVLVNSNGNVTLYSANTTRNSLDSIIFMAV